MSASVRLCLEREPGCGAAGGGLGAAAGPRPDRPVGSQLLVDCWSGQTEGCCEYVVRQSEARQLASPCSCCSTPFLSLYPPSLRVPPLRPPDPDPLPRPRLDLSLQERGGAAAPRRPSLCRRTMRDCLSPRRRGRGAAARASRGTCPARPVPAAGDLKSGARRRRRWRPGLVTGELDTPAPAGTLRAASPGSPVPCCVGSPLRGPAALRSSHWRGLAAIRGLQLGHLGGEGSGEGRGSAEGFPGPGGGGRSGLGHQGAASGAPPSPPRPPRLRYGNQRTYWVLSKCLKWTQ